MALVKLDHSARLLGSDLADLAEDVVCLLPKKSRYFIAQFLARDDRTDTLLSKMGFAAYGAGSAFVYDNATPGTPRSPRSPAKARGDFVVRQRYTSTIPGDTMAIRVKDGALVVTDDGARRSVFPLTGPDAPAAVVRAFRGKDRWWVVIDRQGRAIVSGADDDWSREAFTGIGAAAGLPYKAEALAPGYAFPVKRSDHVELSRGGRSNWLGVAFLLLIVLGLYALIGLWAGYPWFWAVLWGSVGTVWNLNAKHEKAQYDRNLAALPLDEKPLTPHREITLGRSMLSLGVFALAPTALVYLIRGAGPLP